MDPGNTCVNLSEQMSILKSRMLSLLIEKKSPDVVEQKKSLICQQAKEILLPKGNEQFNRVVLHYIDCISSVRPGRKLLRELVKYNRKIEIIEDKISSSNPFKNYISLKIIDSCKYNTIDNKTGTAPGWITLAHELIHKLHFSPLEFDSGTCFIGKNRHNTLQAKYLKAVMFDNPDPLSYSVAIKKNIIKNITCLVEQHAITGYNHLLFEFGEQIKSIDVLCENVFLLAKNLPFRIDHREGMGTDIEKIDDTSASLETYINWLRSEIHSIRVIPTMYEDHSSLVDFLVQNPLAISSLPEHLTDDLELFEKIFYKLENKKELFKIMPNLMRDKKFILKIILQNLDFDLIGPDLLKNREFILQILENLKRRGNFLAIEKLLITIDDSLKNDPEFTLSDDVILKILSELKYSALVLPAKYLNQKPFVLEVFNTVKKHKNKNVFHKIYALVEKSLKNDPEIVALYKECLSCASK